MRNMTEEQFNLKVKEIQLKREQAEFRNKIKEERTKLKQVGRKNKIRTSNIVLVSSIAAIIIFTIACLYIQYHTATEVSSTLITLWFSFWTVEIFCLTGIKVTKILKEYKSPKDEQVEQPIEQIEDDDIEAVG